jgi:exodeoxyribonuclease VII small subunit
LSRAEREPQGLDGLLDRLEAVIGRLSDPSAPLERLVADYEEAGRLVEAAQGHLDAATERLAGAGAIPGTAKPPARD